MAENGKNGFHTVKEADMEEYKQKLKDHRWKVIKRTAVIILVVLFGVSGIGIFSALRHYENFDIRSSVERLDTEGTRFVEFQGNILKYSNDGAFYTDAQNELIWNQPYEMSDARMDVCKEYLTLYDKKGNLIYIFTKDGLQGSIETTMPIDQVVVAAQGTVAVLMRKEGVGYLSMYDRSGENLAQGAIHGGKGGYPIAIALSYDAIKLAVSMIDINDGIVKSTVAFYNFGAVGQNVTDHCVGISSFADTVIPEIAFVSDERMVAFADSSLIIFEGSQKPQMTAEIPLEKQAQSIFYNEEYIGIVSNSGDEVVTHRITVYDTKGHTILEKDLNIEYSSIEFLSNNEICILNENVCDIYTVRGIYKFHYEFDRTIYKIIPGVSSLNYTFILRNETERVRLK